MKSKFSEFFLSVINRDVILLVLLLLLSRLIPHWTNFTALGAVSILAPRWLKQNKFSLVIPLVALVLSDLILGFHAMMFFTYGAIFIVSVLSWYNQVLGESKDTTGSFVGGELSAQSLGFGSVAVWSVKSSVIFYLVTNFGAWLNLEMYPKTLAGLGLSYWNGLPFLFNDFFGTLIYSGIAILVLSNAELHPQNDIAHII